MEQQKITARYKRVVSDVEQFVIDAIEAERERTGRPSRSSVMRKVLTQWALGQQSVCAGSSEEMVAHG
jgi:hypothetical protein